jgi:hypothetical protein
MAGRDRDSIESYRALASGSGFGACHGTQPRNSFPQARDLVTPERACGFDGSKQQLLDRTRNLAGFNKAQGRTDAA